MKKPATSPRRAATKGRAANKAGNGPEPGEASGEADAVALDVAATEVAADPAPEPAPVADEPAEAEAQAAAPEPALASPEETITELKDRLLRAMAETENVRRRAERDREEARKYAVTGLARDLVGIVDNLHRALAAAPAVQDEEEGVLKSLLVGVEMTQRELLAVLERHDIRAINPIGEKFDPNYHQAMFEVPESGQAPGTVVEVTEIGYAIAGRLLRPAAVGIAGAAKDGDGTPPRIDTKV